MRNSASYGLLFVGCCSESAPELELDAQQRILRFALGRVWLGERTALDLDAQQRILRQSATSSTTEKL
jgi:hypothetical protein